MKTHKLPDLTVIKAAAQGVWLSILLTLGIDRQLLNGKHQPCPSCGGKDRFRYTDFQGNGGFICNQCTPKGGSGFDLIMLIFGCTFAESVARVASVLGMSNEPATPLTPVKPTTTSKRKKDQQAELLRIWQQTTPLNGNDPASLYLKGRGLILDEYVSELNNLRFGMVEYWLQNTENRPVLFGVLPCMVGAITSATGELQGLHLTYLQAHSRNDYQKLNAVHFQTGEPLPAKKMRNRFSGSLNGAAVHLLPPDEKGRVMVAEGIESALAAFEMFGIPCVATLSANGMAQFAVTPNMKDLYIVGDNDRAGVNASRKLMFRVLGDKLMHKVNFWYPPTFGFDALDELNRVKAEIEQLKRNETPKSR